MKQCCDCGRPINQRATRCRSCDNRRRARPPAERFWEKVEKRDDGCWMWLGSHKNDGYAKFNVRYRRSVLAHRFAYELLVGPIPEGLHIDHLCRNRGCVNPAHMEPVTHAENNRRGLNGVLKTRCVHGHDLTVENAWIRAGVGKRRCRLCNQEAWRRYKCAKQVRSGEPVEALDPGSPVTSRVAAAENATSPLRYLLADPGTSKAAA